MTINFTLRPSCIGFFFICLWAIFPVSAQNKGMKPVQGIAPEGTERRLALVVGNKDYQYTSRLNNPVNDADDMATALQSLGFEVILKKNLTQNDFLRTIDEFGNRLQKYDVGLFYFSGHGVQYAGENYLVPIDADVKAAPEIEYSCVKLGRTMAKMEGANLDVSLAFIDACRDNPFPNSSKSIVAKGLSIPNNPPGSFVAFSTRAGSTADDNQQGRNGLFTSELLKYIVIPNLGIRGILDRTTKGVSTLSNKAQIPGRYDELTGDFVFVTTNNVVTNVEIPIRQEELEIVGEPSIFSEWAVKEEEKAKSKGNSNTKFTDLPFSDMVFIPGGTFQMGDVKGEGESDEKARTVTLDGFWMSKYEIKQAQWEAVMGNNPSYFSNCSNCPVENISWYDAVDFCNKLSDLIGKQRVYKRDGLRVEINAYADGYRLPTEAEWEFAAGGGVNNRTRFGNGKDILSPQEANFNGNMSYKKAYSKEGINREKTLPVGSFKPNSLGLYDMTGNVSEWCQDWYNWYSAKEESNPIGELIGTTKVYRGGAWGNIPSKMRVSSRASKDPESKGRFTGLRIVSPL